jgi:diguanylate cyclase (GGDEF)-like protein
MRSEAASAPFWLLQLGVVLAWIGIWDLGRILEQTASVSLWFPPAALSFAAFLAVGWWALVPVMTGALVTTFHSAAIHGDPRGLSALVVSGLAFGGAHALAYGLGAELFERGYGDSRIGTPRGVVGFLLASTLAALLAAVGGLSSLAATGTPQAGLSANLVAWWIGDLVSVVTLAPLFLLAIDAARQKLGLASSGWREGLERLAPANAPLGPFVLKLGASLALALALSALAGVSSLKVPVALVVYALIVPLMWIAHTEGAVRTIVAVAALAAAVVVATRLFGSTEQAFNYQAAMIAIAGTGLFNLTVPRLYADNRRLRGLVTFDQLTGARTRPAFFEAAAGELERARRYGAPLAVVAFDLDHFKSVNDTLGHGAGDRVLGALGDTCRAELRGVDVFGRLGGEEFAVLLPAADLAAARLIAERLRAALEQTDWSERVGTRRVTASFGVTCVDTADASIGPALDRADRALYEAKRSGRNRVCTA